LIGVFPESVGLLYNEYVFVSEYIGLFPENIWLFQEGVGLFSLYLCLFVRIYRALFRVDRALSAGFKIIDLYTISYATYE